MWSPRPAPPRSNPVEREHSMSQDRKSTRLNSSHSQISYAVFCLKKQNNRRLPAGRAENIAVAELYGSPRSPTVIVQPSTASNYARLRTAQGDPHRNDAAVRASAQ